MQNATRKSSEELHRLETDIAACEQFRTFDSSLVGGTRVLNNYYGVLRSSSYLKRTLSAGPLFAYNVWIPSGRVYRGTVRSTYIVYFVYIQRRLTCERFLVYSASMLD